MEPPLDDDFVVCRRVVHAFGRECDFSQQEEECVLLDQLGVLHKIIASNLRIGESTAKEYIARAAAKAGCKDRRELRAKVLAFACGGWRPQKVAHER